MRSILLLFACLCLSVPTAWADDAVSASVPMSHDPQKAFELKLGFAAGGPFGLIWEVDGVKKTSTETVTGVTSARIRLPRLSSRILELYGVIPNGVGVNLKNDDFRLGNFRFSVVDVGLFWNAYRPVSVRRVERGMDLTLGTGVEYLVNPSWTITLDWRIFLPADVFRLLTDYGDFARLVGREAVQGGQTWFGFSYCW